MRGRIACDKLCLDAVSPLLWQESTIPIGEPSRRGSVTTEFLEGSDFRHIKGAQQMPSLHLLFLPCRQLWIINAPVDTSQVVCAAVQSCKRFCLKRAHSRRKGSWTDLGDLPLNLSLKSGSGKGNTGPMLQLPSVGCLCHFHLVNGCLSWDRHLEQMTPVNQVPKHVLSQQDPGSGWTAFPETWLEWASCRDPCFRNKSLKSPGDCTIYPTVSLGSQLPVLQPSHTSPRKGAPSPPPPASAHVNFYAKFLGWSLCPPSLQELDWSPRSPTSTSEFGSQSMAMLLGQVIHNRAQEPSPGDLVLPWLWSLLIGMTPSSLTRALSVTKLWTLQLMGHHEENDWCLLSRHLEVPTMRCWCENGGTFVTQLCKILWKTFKMGWWLWPPF